MKTYHQILLLILLVTFSSFASAQTNPEVKKLVEQGVALHDEGKYDDAVAKYKEAIKIDPNYSTAYYEIGLSLNTQGKNKEAITYLEKLIILDPKSAGGYNILGNIADDDKQFAKAVAYYAQGLKADPTYQRLYFNLAVAYRGQNRNAEAEQYAIEAIKLEPKHASSHRIYALATASENKRGKSLLAWCSFLMLEPQGERAVYANKQIRELINYGIKPAGEKKINISVSTEDMDSGNFMMPIAVLGATSSKLNLSRTDSLLLQLKSLFQVSSGFAGKTQDSFYQHYFSDYFKKLAESNNMDAFVHFITLPIYKDENLQWFKDNNDKQNAYDSWITATKREF